MINSVTAKQTSTIQFFAQPGSAEAGSSLPVHMSVNADLTTNRTGRSVPGADVYVALNSIKPAPLSLIVMVLDSQLSTSNALVFHMV